MAHPFTKMGGALADLEKARDDRLDDSRVLLSNGRYAAAMAQALYAAEIALKVVICRTLNLDNLPRAFEIHALDALLMFTGLSQKMKAPRHRKVSSAWEEVVDVSERINDLRYLPNKNWDRSAAETTLKRVAEVISWLKKNG